MVILRLIRIYFLVFIFILFQVSRALGDFIFKDVPSLPAIAQKVSAEAEIRCEQRSSSDEFLIIACDGIWDVMSNEVISH